MRKALLLIALLLPVSMAGATTIGSESVTVDLEDSTVEVLMEVEELTTQNFTYITSYDVRKVQARSSGEKLQCSVNDLTVGSEIKCEPPETGNFTVELEFKGSGFVSKEGDARIFRYSQSFYRPRPDNKSNYKFKVFLPEGGRIPEGGNLSRPSISPPDGNPSSDGRRIYVSWNKNPKLGDTMRFQVVYDVYSNGKGYLNYILIGSGIILGFLLFYVGYIYWNRESIESVYGELTEDEVEVLEILRENGGSVLQKDVVNKTDYSKAKISGIVSGLVEKDIITKEKEGRSNKLSISRKYRG